MKQIDIDESSSRKVVEALRGSTLFGTLEADALGSVARSSTLYRYDANETIVRQGEDSDRFFLVLQGEASVHMSHETTGESVEVAVLSVSDSIGEMGLLLGESRSATVVAVDGCLLMGFDAKTFHRLFERVPEFGLAISRSLARRLNEASTSLSLHPFEQESGGPSPEVFSLLPIELISRHRVLPLKLEGKNLTIGFVDDPTPASINAVRRTVSGMEVSSVRLSVRDFNEALQSRLGVEGWEADNTIRAMTGEVEAVRSPKLDKLVKRMAAEGASDAHLSALQKPRWRIDGDIREVADTRALGADEVYSLFDPILDERSKQKLVNLNDVDRAYSVPGVGRLRINLFRDSHGIGAVLRHVPDRILSLEQLGLPDMVENFCTLAHGLVVVTGPSGSGKSTTLAAMVDCINKTRPTHIITLEDPIEFVHKSRKSLINQRELHAHMESFSGALSSALREDPDIVLVGEMRDRDTIALALETASTGHLVLGTLHTNSALGTIERVVEMFPTDRQNQIRGIVADTLKGVVAQTLCKRVGGGRLAAIEVLKIDETVSKLIRDGKTHQLSNILGTRKGKGVQLLNNSLARFVKSDKITLEEAMAKSYDRDGLATIFNRRLGRDL